MPDFSHILLATDLDGTFFGKHATLLDKNIEAAEYFKANGGHFIAATGRVFPNVLLVAPDAPKLFNAPSVTSNGAYIYDFSTGETLHKTPMDAKALKALMLEVQDFNPNIAMRVSTDKGFLVNANRINSMMQKEIESPAFVGDVIPLEDWITDGAEWYKTVLRGDHEELCRVKEALYPAYDDYFEFCASSLTLFEMEAKGCTKATGVRFVADRMEAQLGHPLTIVAMGDQENDIPMLSAAHLSACPENALDTVKAVSKLHLCHHAEGAFCELVAYLDKNPHVALGKV